MSWKKRDRERRKRQRQKKVHLRYGIYKIYQKINDIFRVYVIFMSQSESEGERKENHQMVEIVLKMQSEKYHI